MWLRIGATEEYVNSDSKVSELGFLRTRRRAGLSEILAQLSSSVEQDASTIGSSTRETLTEETNRDRRGRSLELDLAGLMMIRLSWLVLLLLLRLAPLLRLVLLVRLVLLLRLVPLLLRLLNDRLVEFRSTVLGVAFCGSGCARICVTRLLKLSDFIVGWDGIQVVL